LPDDLSGLAGYISAAGQRLMLTGFAASENPNQKTSVAAVLWAQASDRSCMARCATSCRPPVSSGPLAVADYDGDSDLDLFVGGRFVSGTYPQPATSRLFISRMAGCCLTMAINHSSIRSDSSAEQSGAI